MNPLPPKNTTPVEAGKVGVFYFPETKQIAYRTSFPHKGNIITALSVLIADNEAALEVAIAEAQLIERK
jgi:hypothetical protein